MKKLLISAIPAMILAACAGGGQNTTESQNPENMFTGADDEVKLMTLDPGHFHAALVQKSMYDQVDPTVYVYAPEGPDVQDHMKRIEQFNTRSDNPTSWNTQVYTGSDFLEKMLTEKPGNVVVLSGNNAKKTEYIMESVSAGLNVLADKPMVIEPEEFSLLERAFDVARQNEVLLYDIMTERYEVTTILQRELSQIPEVFGELVPGTPEEPAITKESVHHFYKMVSGNPLKRPAWFFDVHQQGEGIVDVTTHLVDLVQWESFPEVVLSKEDVEIVNARRWTTNLTGEMFRRVTQLDEYPEYLIKDVENDTLKVYSNGEINYKLKGVHAKVSVIWNYEAPAGAGDTHYSIMRGTKSNLIIRQGEEENYKPTLYVEANEGVDPAILEASLMQALSQNLESSYQGLELVKLDDGSWKVEIPDRYRVGHEAHFAQVTEKFLNYLAEGSLPEWEIPNMIVKYYTITEAMKAATE